MVDVELLKRTITDSGIPITTICRRTGIKRETFYRKLGKPNSIKVGEIDRLSSVLNLTQAERNRIFFANNVEFNSTRK